jgi:hypothetical protein
LIARKEEKMRRFRSSSIKIRGEFFAAVIVSGLLISSICLGYSGGSGTPEDPYRIATAEDLNDIGNHPEDWEKHFILINDVDLVQYTGTKFNIIGKGPTYFTGIFNGNGHKIFNFTWTSDSIGNIGLFSIVGSGGQVKNLKMENVDVNAINGYCVGGLAGTNVGTITNCYSTGSVTGYRYVSGLVGYNYGTVTNCYSIGSVTGNDGAGRLGGLVGENWYGTITNCYSTGIVTGNAGCVGGLVGLNYQSTVTNCYSTSIVDGGDFVGGLVGGNYGGTISYCYSTGSVSGASSLVGGLVGWNSIGDIGGTINDCYSTGSVTGGEQVGGLVGKNGHYNLGYYIPSYIYKCYSTGEVTGSSDVGGLVGLHIAGEVGDSFWDIETSGCNTSAGGTGKTTAEMQTKSTFTDAGWDFIGETVYGVEDIWRMCVDGVNYPILRWQFNTADFVCPDGVEINDLAIMCEEWLLEELSRDVWPEGGDGIVNFLDWAVFANQWQITDGFEAIADFAGQWLKTGARYCIADIAPAGGGDGIVNMLDFAVLASNWLEGESSEGG